MNVTIERFDPHDVDEAGLRTIHDVYVAAEADWLPDDTPMPFEQRRVKLRAPIPTYLQVRRWVARADGDIVGTSYLTTWPEDDPDNGYLWMGVSPAHRRRGIGKALAGAGLDAMEEDGVKSVIVDASDGHVIEGFLHRIGMKRALSEVRSRLKVADIDWDLMDAWIRRAGERADGYHIEFLEMPIPEEKIERWCRVHEVMNTAPLEGLDIEERFMTPAKWREEEAAQLFRGDHRLACIAVHDQSGDFAGFTDIVVQRHQREFAYQDDTAVDPAHRNKGLGRWVKAALIRRLVEQYPEIVYVDTFNAGSNDSMLNINVEMGYKPILAINAWQGDLPRIRSALGS